MEVVEIPLPARRRSAGMETGASADAAAVWVHARRAALLPRMQTFSLFFATVASRLRTSAASRRDQRIRGHLPPLLGAIFDAAARRHVSASIFKICSKN